VICSVALMIRCESDCDDAQPESENKQVEAIKVAIN
jgi:hypothetical protein